MSIPLALLASTFTTVFVAELGDKTQLAIVSISGTSSRPGAVFAGSASALVLASLLGAAAGGSLSTVISPDILQLAASLGFLLIGGRLIQRSMAEVQAEGREEVQAEVRAEPSARAGAPGEDPEPTADQG